MDQLKILSGKDRDEYTPIIKEFLETENPEADVKDLTHTRLNMSTLEIILENLGYTLSRTGTITPLYWRSYEKEGCKTVTVRADVTTFMLTIEIE